MNRAVQYLRRLSQDPPEQSISLICRIEIFMNFIIVHNVFLLLVIIVIKAIQPDCYKIKGSSVLLLETPLTRSKYISPYTHTQHLRRTSRIFYTFPVTKPLKNTPSLMPTLRNVRIRSATGRDVQTLGRTKTQFKLGVSTYSSEFIVCRNLRRPAI